MRKAYPVVLSPGEKGYVVYVPDLDINTEGYDIADAIAMARDAIGIWGVCTQDGGREIPEPFVKDFNLNDNELLSYVDIDFDEYRRQNEMKAVRKNCTIPSWLNAEAEKAGINFSKILQDALIEKLGVQK